MDINRLIWIGKHCVNTYNTSCGETADVFAFNILNETPAKITRYDGKWNIKTIWSKPLTFNHLYGYLKKGHVFVGLDIYCDCKEDSCTWSIPRDFSIDHTFLLVKGIDKKIYIVDSYINRRKCRIEPFELERLRDLLNHPTMTKWNELFLVDHNPHDKCRIEMRIINYRKKVEVKPSFDIIN